MEKLFPSECVSEVEHLTSGLTRSHLYYNQPALNRYRGIPENGLHGLTFKNPDVVNKSLIRLSKTEPLKEEGQRSSDIILDNNKTVDSKTGLGFSDVVKAILSNRQLQNSSEQIAKAGLQNLTNALVHRIAPPAPTLTNNNNNLIHSSLTSTSAAVQFNGFLEKI